MDVLQLQQALEEGIVITPNLRLHRELTRKYGELQLEAGRSVWQPPQIYALQPWLEQLWQQHRVQTEDPDRKLISATQARLLWEDIIDRSDCAPFGGRSIAQSAYEAYALCQLWQVDRSAAVFDQAQDSRHWCLWADRFEVTLKNRHLITETQAVAAVIEALVAGSSKLLSQITLTGFDSVAPLHQKLFSVISKRVAVAEPKATNQASIVRFVAPDSDAEIAIACEYAKQYVERHPDKRIAIIVSDLAARRGRVEQIATRVFEPQAILPEQQRYPLPFNFSVGEQLSQTSLVRAAMAILSIQQRHIEVDLVQRLLHTPFIAGFHEEQEARALLKVKLLKLGRPKISMDLLVKWAQGFSFSNTTTLYSCPHWAKSMQAIQNINENAVTSQSPRQWSEYFLTKLKNASFTNDSLTSIEYQQRELLLMQLEQLSDCDDLFDKVTHAQALAMLHRLIQQAVFQPKTQVSPIQFLGMLEAAGLSFDVVWVAGMHDQAWPAPAKATPFIPYKIQCELGMPHATPEREWQFSTHLFKQYCDTNQKIIVSYPDQTDGKKIRPSVLVENYGIQSVDQLLEKERINPSYLDIVFSKKAYEWLEDKDALALPVDVQPRGGASLLKNQAMCGFRAFVIHRLYAEEPPSIEEGLNKVQRGNLLHACMKRIWDLLQDHHTLVNTSADELVVIIDHAIADEVLIYRDLGENFLELEKQRLKQLINEWLIIEKQRFPFVVVATEKSQAIELGPLHLNVRVDRIDQTEQGHIVIDYKTSNSSPSISAWKSNSLFEPQLPLYAIADKNAIKGIYFAHVLKKKCQWIGVSADNQIIPTADKSFKKWQKDMGNTWEETIEYWRGMLSKLADDFAQGLAHIEPSPNACKYCCLKMVCRAHVEER